MIQALVLLFIGADVLILWLWQPAGACRCRGCPRFARQHCGPSGASRGLAASDVDVAAPAARAGGRAGPGAGRWRASPAGRTATGIVGDRSWRSWPSGSPSRRSRRGTPAVPVVMAVVALGARRVDVLARARAGSGSSPMSLAVMFGVLGAFATQSSVAQPRVGLRLVGRSSPRCSATRRRSSSPPSAACSPSAAAW